MFLLVPAHLSSPGQRAIKRLCVLCVHTVFDCLMSMFAERNLNPKAACLKRREEEKADEYSASHNIVASSDAVLHSSVVCLLLSFVPAHISSISSVILLLV